MFMAMTEAQLAHVTEFDLLPEYPEGFEPEQIIYRRIISINRGFGGEYDIIDRARPVTGEKYANVEEFAKMIAAGRYDELDKVDQVPRQVRPLDILVSKASFIVLSLSPDEGSWTFAGTPQRAGVTMGEVPDENNPPTLYGGLTYATPTAVSRTRKAGCAVVFFGAMPSFGTVAKPYIQKLNYVILGDHGYNNLMDPDIRHPGVTEP